MHWLLHVLGIDTQQSYFYDFWSGIATQASLLMASLSIWKRHNCHEHWCWRVGRFQVQGTPFMTCKYHHPRIKQRISSDFIMQEHLRSTAR